MEEVVEEVWNGELLARGKTGKSMCRSARGLCPPGAACSQGMYIRICIAYVEDEGLMKTAQCTHTYTRTLISRRLHTHTHANTLISCRDCTHMRTQTH